MDLRQQGIPFEKKYVQFSKENIQEFAQTFHHWQGTGHEENYQDVPEYCYSAGFDEIDSKDFSLVPSKYIEFINRDENIDFDEKMSDLQTEIADLLKEEARSKSDLLKVFKELGYEIEL